MQRSSVRDVVAFLTLGVAMGAPGCGHDVLLPIETDEAPPACTESSCPDGPPGLPGPGREPVNLGRGVPQEPQSGKDAEALCESTLADVMVATAEASGAVIELWPPNGDLYPIALADCVGSLEVCGWPLSLHIVSVSADQEIDLGADILDLSCDQVTLRAKRHGDNDGRVYTIRFAASDAWSNTAEGFCYVLVPHDSGDVEPVGDAHYTVRGPDDCGL